MIENATKQMCGACGGFAFEIFSQGENPSDFKLIVECQKCKSTTIIEAEKPSLKLEWGEDSKGSLAPSKGKKVLP